MSRFTHKLASPEQRIAYAKVVRRLGVVDVTRRCNAHDALLADRDRLRAALEQIASRGGNLPDIALESRTGPNDAVARGLMYTACRAIARAALAQSDKGE